VAGAASSVFWQAGMKSNAAVKGTANSREVMVLRITIRRGLRIKEGRMGVARGNNVRTIGVTTA
jgi:hypothetical protein